MRQKWICVPPDEPLLIQGRLNSFSEVVRPFRYDMPDPSAEIDYISGIARDYMKMEVRDGLSGRRTMIEPNVKARDVPAIVEIGREALPTLSR